MSKIITEELIQERLEDKGVTVPHETSQGDKISKLELEYGFEEVIETIYEEWYMESHEEIETELVDEGYEWPKSE